MTTKRSLLAVGSVALLVLASCGDDSDESSSTEVATTTSTMTSTTDEPADSTISIEGAWARTSPSGVDKGAAYMVITSSIDDRLVAVEVPDDIAMDAQLHEMAAAEGGMTDTTDMSGGGMTGSTGMTGNSSVSGDTMAPSMVMTEVDAIDLPAGEAVALEPGGYHVMLIGLVSPLTAGQEFTLTLTFEQAGDIDVTVVVADDAPAS